MEIVFGPMPSSKDVIELEGVISEALPNTMFRVTVDDTAPQDYAGTLILCTLSGKMRLYRIRVMPGDRVKLEVTPYDKKRGRITFRVRQPDTRNQEVVPVVAPEEGNPPQEE